MTDFFRGLIEASPRNAESESQRFEEFIHQLKLNGGGVFEESQKDLESQIQHFLFEGYLSKIIHRLKTNDVVKLPDLIANAYRGVYPSIISSIDVVVEQIFKNVAFALHLGTLQNGQLLSSLCLNLSSYWDPGERFVRDFHLQSNQNYLAPLIQGLDKVRRASIYKFYLRHCRSADEVDALFNPKGNESFFSDVVELLISKSSFDSRTTGVLLCCFREQSLEVLLEFLKLWSDPVIAKANASTEIFHYTQAIFISFYHIPSFTLKSNYLEISRALGEGLPNHFSSTDPRTLKLAKFLSDFMIYTLKLAGTLGEKDEESMELPINPTDDLSNNLLTSYHPCCPTANNFWYNKYYNSSVKKIGQPSEPEESSPIEEIDSDDDDDLEPIESLDAPIKCPVVYVRDFIENLPNYSENIDQMTLIFQRLPCIIDAQLRLEHPNTSKEMLDIVFSWNNSFNEAALDETRKKSLEAILIASPQVTIPELCRYFHNRPNMIAPDKCLILDVLCRTLSNPQLDLSILKCMADSYFHIILREDSSSIREQAAPVQVPMVLLSAQILTRLPCVMSRDSYLKSFLSTINGLALDSDHGMKETIVFALHQICKSPIVTSSSSLSPEIRHTLGETRNLLSKVLE